VLLLVLVGLVLSAAFVGTRGPVLRAMVEPSLEEALGSDVEIGGARLTLGGALSISGLRVAAPDLDGEAATLLEASQARIEMGWGRLLRAALGGAIRPRRIALEAPLIRVSSEASGGGFNIDALLTGGDRPAAGGGLPESVVIEGGRLEFGEHLGGTYQGLSAWMVDGRLESDRADGRAFRIALEQKTEGTEEGARLEGLVDLADGRVDLALQSLRITAWPAAPLSDDPPTWRELVVEGVVERAALSYAPSESPSGELVIANVELRAPIAQDDEVMELQMSRVDGAVRFDASGVRGRVSGVVEDLPAQVTLETEGLAPNAPAELVVRTDRFVVSERPRLLPLAPEDARRAFREFSGPTAIVSGEVVLRRGAPIDGEAAPFETRGSLFIEQATAAQINFPYPTQQVQGEISFSGERVRVDLRGRGPTGAILRADGYVTLGDDSEISLHIYGERVPMDEALIESMPEEWRPLVRSFLSEEAAQTLIDAQMMQSPALRAERIERLASLRIEAATMESGSAVRRVELQRELERLEALAALPVFAPGGYATVQAHVHREQGGEILFDIEARAPRLDLLMDEFPYPLRASDVAITIASGAVGVESAQIGGLSGGGGRLEALLGEEQDDEIRLLMTDIPIDGFLLHMLPDESGATGEASIREAVASMGLSGVIRSADIEARPNGEDLSPSAVIEFDGVEASPRAGDGASPGKSLRITDVAGVVRLSEQRIAIGPIEGRVGEAPLSLRIDVSEPAADGPSVVAGRVEIIGLDVAARIEDALRPGLPDIAAEIASFRAEHEPSGRLDVDAEFASGGDGLDATVRLREPRDLTLDVEGGRLGLRSAGGVVELGQEEIVFEEVAGTGLVDGIEVGSVRLDGRAAFEEDGALALEAKLTSAPFHAPSIRRAVTQAAQIGDGGGASPVNWSTLAGLFDADVSIEREAGGEPVMTGVIRPRSAEFDAGEERVRFERINGAVHFDELGGRFDGLRLMAEAWETTLNGAWTASPALRGELEISAEGERLPEDLVALLPEDVRAAFNDLDLRADGGFELDRATLGFSEAEGAEGSAGPPSLSFRGDVSFAGVSFGAAAPVSDFSGKATIVAGPGVKGSGPRLDVDIRNASGIAAGIQFTGGAARLQSEGAGSQLMAPRFTAAVHGGRLAGSAEFNEIVLGDRKEPRMGFTLDVRIAGVDLAGLAADATRSADAAESKREDDPRGKVEAHLSLSGVVGLPELSEGRGSLQVSGGELVKFPLLMRILEVSALQAPRGEPVDQADARFFILGERAYFETLVVRSRSIVVMGTGTASWPGLDLDVRFRTSGAFRVPIISNIVDVIRNELATIVVTGPIDAPEFSTVQLPGTRQVLQGVVGQDVDGQGEGVGRPRGTVGSEPPTLAPVRPGAPQGREERPRED